MINKTNEQDFWYELEHNNDKILKWNPNGEYNRVFSNEDKSLLDYFHNLPVSTEISVGDIINGKISSITKKDIVIDVNYKDSIYVDIKVSDLKIIQNLKKGDDLNVMVTEVSEFPFQIKGSITELIKIDVANKLRDSFLNQTPLVAKVIEVIPAGFMLEIVNLDVNIQAFMPNTLAGVNRLTPEQTQSFLGKEINVMLETLQQEKGVYVVSRKKYLNSLVTETIEQLKKDRIENPEKAYEGIVTGTKDFGVFVEFNGCLTGMIHKVNINPAFQDKLSEIKPGTPIDFYVRDILKGDKLILTQILRDSLWDSIRVGQVKEGVVRSVKPFGALVALDEETTGLIQNSYIEKANKSLKKGDTIKIKIVSVIKDDRKIYLDFAKAE